MSSGYLAYSTHTSISAGRIIKDTSRTESSRTVFKNEIFYSFKVEHQSQNVGGGNRELSGKRGFENEHCHQRTCSAAVCCNALSSFVLIPSLRWTAYLIKSHQKVLKSHHPALAVPCHSKDNFGSHRKVDNRCPLEEDWDLESMP